MSRNNSQNQLPNSFNYLTDSDVYNDRLVPDEVNLQDLTANKENIPPSSRVRRGNSENIIRNANYSRNNRTTI